MASCYELTQSANGQYHFVLKAGNGEVILRSEQYESKGAAQAGIASVQKNCAVDANYERKESSTGQPYFNLKALNHQVIGTSQMYKNAANRDAGIEAVKAHGATVVVKA
jgi:uncharacterized protein